MSNQDKPSYDELYQLWLDAKAKIAACKECGPDCIDPACASDTDRWRQYFNLAPYGMFIADRQSQYTEVNPAAEAITGYPAEELTQMSIADILHPDDRRKGLEVFQTLRQTGSCKAELRYVCKGGQVRWWTVSGSCIDENRYLGFVNDITERKRAEFELRNAEVRFQAVAEATSDCILVWDRDYNYIFANQAAIDHVGATREQVIGKSIREGLGHVPDFMQLWMDRIDRVFETKEELLVEDAIAIGETLVYSESKLNPIFDSDGAVRAVAVVYRDISERKQAEQALRESEARYRCLAENFPEGALFLLGPDLRYEAANGKAFIAAGLKPERVVGRTVQEVFPELWDALQEPIRRAFQGEDVYYEVEFRGRHYANRSVYIPPQSDQEPRVLIITQDITDQKTSEKERTELQEQLLQSQKLSAVGKLAGGVAHDFNNMLNVILGHADMLLQDTPQDDPSRQDLEAIHNAALRSADLTKQLLAFARRQTIAPKLLNLNETIASMISMLRRLIGEHIDLLWQPGEGIESVHIDPAQVDQLLTNLVINARDAIDEAGKITIETAAVSFDEDYCNTHPDFLPGTYVMLGVNDDGRGMDGETRKHIFEPFFTTKSIGEGTGLGLATAYGIIKQNGGFVNVYSEPGQGTSLHIYLPAAGASSPTKQAPAEPTDTYPTGTETILLVEDEPPILAMGEKMLARMGYRVLAAATPSRAILIANEHDGPIDLLVTDVIMPQMHGRDLATKLSEIHPDIAKIFMSGYTANVIAHQGVLDEGVHFLQKPFSAKALGEKVREVLDAAD